MQLSYKGLKDKAAWERAGIKLPGFDIDAMLAATQKAPIWVHFGAGNIFRAFIAVLQQRLLEEGLVQSGIIAAETFDFEIIDRVYTPYDCNSLLVKLKADGETEKEVVASVVQAIRADSGDASEWAKMVAIFENPGLQLASFTITEKGYTLVDAHGSFFPVVAEEIANGPKNVRSTMSIVTALMLARFKSGATPIALVSMDNCSRNGEKFRESVLTIANCWLGNGYVEKDFIDYISDEKRVSFPWSMVDKITPAPAETISKQLAELGILGMEPVVTAKKTFIAPFVNAEIPQYLVIEDRFPNSRPPLEMAGVYLTDRETVNKTERMKVTTCLNPLHTALALYGSLLDHDSIAAAVKDPELASLVERIGYVEGMPVVTDPGILSPKRFIKEVLEERMANPFIPDTPSRIATDTSQKIPIRFGETIKSYMDRPDLSIDNLFGIPLVLAGWLRYLLAVDDDGNEMPVSPDPMLAEMQSMLCGIKHSDPSGLTPGQLQPILSNPVIFGVDLYDAGIAGKVEKIFTELLDGPGTVRRTLRKYLHPAVSAKG